jgi:hypothetical protein
LASAFFASAPGLIAPETEKLFKNSSGASRGQAGGISHTENSGIAVREKRDV